MTWIEFMDKVDMSGVKATDEIVYIDFSCSKPGNIDVEVFVRPDGSRSFHVN